ncbi:hypothetical protein NC653_009065 [Populus alba x Populus x berolinensis]|uniref:Uncharacterized protein n=1 Tax=Populus alba x Populus x berolinensis TaxID=444605 RepID=A0AAD6R959_9ROSI|nr:hypothetical protein NC653_009065 [Populus alba x Populus x berolinensis]
MKCAADDFLSANTGKTGKKNTRRREEAGFSRTLLHLIAAAAAPSSYIFSSSQF